jgi:L-lysine exporter family protein LysE/ArgO
LDTVILLGSLANQRAVEGRWWFGVGAASASLVWFSALGFGARLLAPWFATPKAWRLLDAFIAVTMLALGVALLM